MLSSRPGATFVSALEAGKKKYAELGYAEEFDKHHQGREYPVGFDTPGTIADHQAFCWNPSITGTKSEDTVICTSEGVIPVTGPAIFPVNTIEVEGTVFERSGILVRKMS